MRTFQEYLDDEQKTYRLATLFDRSLQVAIRYSGHRPVVFESKSLEFVLIDCPVKDIPIEFLHRDV